MFCKVEFKHNEHERVVYVIHHVKTRKVYVGTSINPNKSVYKHYWLLSRNQHHNRILQEIYNDSKDLYHVYYVVKEKEDRQKIKNALIEYFVKEGRSLNPIVGSLVPDEEISEKAKTVALQSDTDPTIRLGVPPEKDNEKFLELITLDELSLYGVEGLDNVTEDVCFGSKIPGVYVIYHPKTEQFYIGSTSNLYTRLITHRHALKRNKHQNYNLQTAYNEDPLIKASCFMVKNREHAYQIEQYLLEVNWETKQLFNSSPDARNSLALVSYKGVVFSDTRRENMSKARKISNAGATPRKVCINGVVYTSVRDAARSLGLNFSTVHRWINGNTEEYKDWFYVD